MQKIKTFTQYSGDSFTIRVAIGINGNVRAKSELKYCGENTKNRYKKFYQNNKEHRKKQDKKRYEDNKEHILQLQKKEYKNNKEKFNKKNKKSYMLNRDKILKERQKYRDENKLFLRKQAKKWRKNNPDKVHKYKQTRRNFGFNPLNDWFEDSHFHHLHITNPNDGYFIPAKLHNSVRHSHKKPETMDKINKLVLKWIGEQQCV